MSIFHLPEGNVVTVVTLDTDKSSNEFFGVYRTLNLAIADIKSWMKSINEESFEEDREEYSENWDMFSTSQFSQTWKCKNLGNTKTFNFSRYGL